MSWLAALDAKAARWPTPARWAYIGLKWYLVLVGFIALVGVILDRIGIRPFY